MVYEQDTTILTNQHQHDWFTIGHVLYFFFLMFQGWSWWACMLLCYAFEGLEAVVFDFVTVQDGLVVDPLQAAMGLVAFSVLEQLGCASVANKIPSLSADRGEWAAYALSYWWFVPPCAVSLSFHSKACSDCFTNNDWAFIVAFGAMALYRAWQEGGGRKWLLPLYVLAFSGLSVGLNQVPYSPWFGSVYFHSPIVVVWAAMLLKKLADARMWSKPAVKTVF